MNQTDGQKKKNKLEIPLFWFFILHLTLILNSTTGVVSKFAGRAKFMSIRFILLYFLLMMICVSFAILWQQVLKRMSLTFAFMNRPITVIYSDHWGDRDHDRDRDRGEQRWVNIYCFGCSLCCFPLFHR